MEFRPFDPRFCIDDFQDTRCNVRPRGLSAEISQLAKRGIRTGIMDAFIRNRQKLPADPDAVLQVDQGKSPWRPAQRVSQDHSKISDDQVPRNRTNVPRTRSAGGAVPATTDNQYG